MNKRNLGVAAVFLLGCATGGVSSGLVVPKASAQQAATLTKWEYKCVESEPAEDETLTSNRFGAAGWEMSGITQFVACFKRPKM
jgi:hypothetical protein